MYESYITLLAAARLAEALDIIHELTDQTEGLGSTPLWGAHGVNLIGGQRQPIVLARVILKNANTLVFDKAPSTLHSAVEAAIQQTLYSMMDGKTVIAIAHRLSTIAAVNRIIVMDQGQLIEEGTHDALLDQDGIYASPWARQLGGSLNALEVTQ